MHERCVGSIFQRRPSQLLEHRALRPNHLLQWACMRWAKAHGARFYDWRTIPDILRPGEKLYGVYQFKRGFDGFERRVLPTHDLVLLPASYRPYSTMVGVRWWWSDSRRRVRERQSERARERARQLTVKIAAMSSSRTPFRMT